MVFFSSPNKQRHWLPHNVPACCFRSRFFVVLCCAKLLFLWQLIDVGMISDIGSRYVCWAIFFVLTVNKSFSRTIDFVAYI